MPSEKTYKNFKQFYPYYLTEHSNPSNRRLHFIGTLLLLACFVIGIITGKWFWFVFIPVVGYGFAWVGHFFIEKNRPATFTYPFYSLASDFVMFWHAITGQLKEKLQQAQDGA